MSETYTFIAITGILIALGFIMPYVNDFAGDSTSANNIEGLSGIESNEISYSSFVGSMATSFFWYYGDLPVFANLIKIAINFVWVYLLARLLRGGG
jgi:hypothetical protein